MANYEFYNQQLSDHFLELKIQRDGAVVYLVEHDVSSKERGEFFGSVSNTLKTRPLKFSSTWKSSYLPLLVAATEVAYRYEGNGTEYWPMLEEKLDCGFSMFERGVLQDLFELFHKEYNGPLPPDTEWSRQFSIICWPIANALLPLDMRLPFSEALANTAFGIEGASDDRIKQRLSGIQVAYSSTRYRNWLATENIAADFARYFLLSKRPATVLPATMQRIETDMVADRQVRLALRNAKIRYGSIGSHNGKAKAKKQKKKFGHLRLRETAGGLKLEATIPPIGVGDAREWLERNTRNGRWRPQPWGLQDAPPLSPSEILFGTPFVVPLRKLFSLTEVPEFLIAENDNSGLPKSVDAWSRSIALNLDWPAAFIATSENIFVRTFSKTIDPSKKHVVALQRDKYSEMPDGIVEVGRISSLSLVRVQEKSSIVENWLNQLGYRLGSTVVVDRIAPAGFGQFDSVEEVYFQTDFIGFSIREIGSQKLTLETSHNGTQIRTESIVDDGLYFVDTSESGEYALAIVNSTSEVIESWKFRLLNSEEEIYDSEVCRVRVSGASNTTVDLTSQALGIEISSIRELSGLDVEIGLSTEDETTILASQALPMKIGAKHSIWEKLVGESTRRAIARGSELTINVKVEDVFEKQWLLENDSPSLWWKFDEGGNPRPVSDQVEYQCHQIGLSSTSLIRNSNDDSTVQLLVPAVEDEPKYELPCLVTCPPETRFPNVPLQPDRLPRQMDEVESFYGLKEWVQKYIALACAKTPNVIAAIQCDRYRQAYLGCIREVLCGRRWEFRREQQEELLRESSPLTVFLKAAETWGAGFVKEATTSPVPQVLKDELQGHVATVLPTHWWRYPIFHFTDNLGEQLDAAFKEAYASVADLLPPEQLELATKWREVHPFTDRGKWISTLKSACETLNGSQLVDLVLPLEGGDSLLKMPLDGLTIDELSQVILDWRSEFLPNHRSSAKWTLDRLRIAVSLFLHPSLLRSCDWESVLEAMLTDRVTSRAICFMAWKKDQLERLADR
jgi:hypothetical protein